MAFTWNPFGMAFLLWSSCNVSFHGVCRAWIMTQAQGPQPSQVSPRPPTLPPLSGSVHCIQYVHFSLGKTLQNCFLFEMAICFTMHIHCRCIFPMSLCVHLCHFMSTAICINVFACWNRRRVCIILYIICAYMSVCVCAHVCNRLGESAGVPRGWLVDPTKCH